LVVIAITAVLMALLLSAVQVVRESANRAHCQNNLRQLAIATHHFHDSRGTLPTYFGIYPPMRNQVVASANPSAIYGGWFAHLLPFVEQGDLHAMILDNVQTTQRNTAANTTISYPATGTWVPPVAGTAGYWNPPRTKVIDNPGTLQWVPVQSQNGYITWVQQLVGQTWHWEPPNSVWVPGTPGTPGYWDPPGSGPRTVTVYEPHGIWLPDSKGMIFGLMICPSDPSVGTDTESKKGLVYARTQDPPWGSTNYLANWWAFAGDNMNLGWTTLPQRFGVITDGLSNTVLFGEGYAWCDGVGRIALYPPNQHNFGLTQALPSTNNQVQIDGQLYTFGSHQYGYPNTWMFQVRPLALPVSRCPAGADCCNRWVAQTGHTVMNVALADGSVRTVGRGISTDTWRRAMQPRDGEEHGSDW
jgi:hypothetical protein